MSLMFQSLGENDPSVVQRANEQFNALWPVGDDGMRLMSMDGMIKLIARIIALEDAFRRGF